MKKLISTVLVSGVLLTALSGCERVVVESNHDIDMLKNGSYPYALKQRILGAKGHLSNEDCAKACVDLAKKGTKKFILGHISENNNAPELAFNYVGKTLSENGINLSLDFCLQHKVKVF